MFVKIFICNKKCRNEIKDNNEKIRSRFNDTVVHKIDFTTFGFQMDNPLAWALKLIYSRQFIFFEIEFLLLMDTY